MRHLCVLTLAIGLMLAPGGTAQAGIVDQMPGLQLWLDAGTITGLSDGDTLNQWDDLSGKVNHARLSMGNPIFQADANGDGNAAVEFPEGAGMFTPLNVSGDDYSVFIVFDSDADSTAYRRAIHGSNNWLIGPYGGQLRYHMGGWAYIGPGFMPVDQYVVAEVTNSTQAWGFYEDGVERAAGAGSRGAPGSISFGADNRPFTWEPERLLGDIAEVIIYDTELTQTDRNAVGFYLAEKYGLTTAYDPPANEMTWDEGGAGNWSADPGRWVVTDGAPAAPFPDAMVDAVVKTDVVNVAADSFARRLTVESGGIAIASGASLTVGSPAIENSVSFGPGTTLSLGVGATFSGGGGNLPAIAPPGDVTIGATQGTLAMAGYTDGGGAARVFTKTGAGVLSLDNADGTAVVAGATTFNIQQGTLRVGGADPFGGSTAVVLDGGKLSVLAEITLNIDGFDDPGGFTLNANAEAAGVAMPTIDGTELQITSSDASQATSAFFNVAQSAGAFTAEFEYQMVDPGTNATSPADGMALVIQGNGPGALGSGGGGRGYLGISDSVAVSLNLWNSRSDVDAGADGAFGARMPTAPINLRDGNPIHVVVDYDGSMLSVDLEDLVTGDTFSTSWSEDVAGRVGGAAYIGFTGGTGGANADQRVRNFTYSSPSGLIDREDVDVLVTESSTLEAITNGSARFGALTMRHGGLTTTGSADEIIFASTTIDPAATWVGFDALVPTKYGGAAGPDGWAGIDANGVAATIAKVGPGTMVLDSVPQNAENVAYEVAEGTLKLGGDVLAGRPLRVAGGTLRMLGTAALGSSPLVLDGGTFSVTKPAGALPTAGLTLHLDAGAITGLADGDPIATWADQSGNGLDATQATAGSQPTYVAASDALDGLPAVRFDGTNDFLTLGDLSASFPNEATLFVITSVNDAAYNLYTTGANDTWWRWNGNGTSYPGMFRTTRIESYTAMPDSGSHVFEVESTADNWEMFVDGVSRGARGGLYEAGFAHQIGTPDNTDGNKFLNGEIAEILIFDRALSAEEHINAGAHLAQKYGVDSGYLIPGVLDMTGTPVSVTSDSTIEAFAEATNFGVLTLEQGALTTKGSPINFAGVTIPAGTTGRVGFDPQTPTDYGTIDVNSAEVTVAKAGPSSWTLSAPVLSEDGNVTWQVEEGTLKLVGADPLAGRPVRVVGGTLEVVGVNPLGNSPLELAGGTLRIADAGFGARMDAYYSFDDPGNLGNDDSGSGHAGTLIDVGPTVSGMIGGGLSFLDTDPTNARMMATPSVDLGTQWTIASWYKGVTGSGWQTLTRGAGNDHHIIIDAGGNLGMYDNAGGGGFRPSGFSMNTLDNSVWHHVAGVADGTSTDFYIDGQYVGTADRSPDTEVSSIGNYLTGTQRFADYLDETFIFNRGLDAGEIAALYDAGVAGDYGDLLTLVPGDLSGTAITVTANSTVNVAAKATVTPGPLTMRHGVLTTMGAGGISFPATNIAPEATSVGFDPQGPTDYGTITNNSTQPAVTISKAGPSSWTLDTPISGNTDNVQWKVDGGTFELTGTNVLEGRPVTVAAGTLAFLDPDPLGSSAVTLAGGTLQVTAAAGGAGGVTLPTDNLLLHLDAGAIGANDGDLVATWNDASGNGNDATQTLAGSQPTYQSGALGGQPVVRFDGNDFLATSTSFDNYTIFTVSQLEGTQNARLISSANNNWLLGYWSNQKDVMHANGVWVAYPGPPADTAPHLYEAEGVGGLNSCYEAGNLLASGVAATTAMGRLELGATGYTGAMTEPSKGDVAEVLIYDGALSSADRNAAGAYLAGKYGLDSSYSALASLDMSGTDLTLTANSTLNVVADGASFGQLTMHRGVLTTMGSGVTFAGTTIAADASTVGFNTLLPANPGQIDVLSPAVVINKTGAGPLVLQSENVGSGLENATFDVQQGPLVAVNGLGAAAVQLNGGELVLAGEADGVDIAYDNAVTVAANSTLTAGSGGFGAAGPLTVTLGSPASGVSLDGSDLTLRATDAYNLNVAGPLSGSGSISVTEGDVTLASGGAVEALKVSGGSLATGADLAVQQLELTDAVTLDTAGNHVVVGRRLKLGDMPYTMEGGTFMVGGTGVVGGADITLSGGVLEIGSGGAPSGMQAYYSFDSSADPASDDSGNGHDGEMLGAEWASDGRIGGAASFDGTSVISALIDVSETEYSVALWVKAASDGHGVLSVTDGDPDPGGWDRTIVLTEGTVSTRTWTDEIIATDPIGTVEDEWHHIVHTVGPAGTGQQIYVDGALAASGVKDMSDFDWQDRILIGYAREISTSIMIGDSDYFEGLIDEVYIYDRALTESDVIALQSPQGQLIHQPDANLVATADSTVQLGTFEDATFGNLTIDSGVTLTFDGAAVSLNDVASGDGAVIDGIVLLRGAMTPTGTLTIDGELEMEDDAQYVCQLDGASNGLLQVTADAFIGGTLDLQAVGSLGAVGEHTRTIVEVADEEGEIIGEFTALQAAGDHLGHGVFNLELRYPDTFTSVEIDVFQAAAGDTNADRKVDNADLQQILGAGSFGNAGDWDWPQGDFNGDGSVNNGDLQLILATGLFGTGTYAAEGAAAVVPEPGTLLMLAGAALGLLLWRRRRGTV